ncbi:hypothetical protein [Enterococcus sp. AZ196]
MTKTKLEQFLHAKKNKSVALSQQRSKNKVTGKQTMAHGQKKRGRPLSK